MKKLLCLFILLFLPFYGFAAEDYYQFTTQDQQQQFNSLTSQLRCLVCQNQNLAESNSGLAADLREQIYQQVQKGKTDKEIIDYLVTRYGNYILYKPPLNVQTVGLWLGPLLILISGLCYLIYYIFKKRREQAC